MEMVTSVVVEEAVSGAMSFVFSSREEKVSQEDLMERLEMAHINLDLALERARMMPITIIALLRKRNKLKDVFKECDDLLGKATDLQQVVPSLHKKIMHVVLPSFIVPSQDVLSSLLFEDLSGLQRKPGGLSGMWSPDVHLLGIGFTILSSGIFLKARISPMKWCEEAKCVVSGYQLHPWKSMVESHG